MSAETVQFITIVRKAYASLQSILPSKRDYCHVCKMQTWHRIIPVKEGGEIEQCTQCGNVIT